MCRKQLAKTQVAGGTGFVKQTLDAFKLPTSKATLLVDAAGYDGWPALASLEAEMHIMI